MEDRIMTTLEFRNLILETLAYTDDDLGICKNTFRKYGYQGTQSNLFILLELLAIKKGIVPNTVQIGDIAWGASSSMLHSGITTNFKREEIKRLYEAFHHLLTQDIISPGAVGNYGPNLPYFHVTDFGLQCIEKLDVMPYDSDLYLDKLRQIADINEWILYYIGQGLSCYNSNCYEASLIMVGLANETLVEILIESFYKYIQNKHPDDLESVKVRIEKDRQVSLKYTAYRSLIKDNYSKKDSNLKSLSKFVDDLANESYLTFLRLTRNELSHPSELRVDRITGLMIFLSYVKYCENQYKYITYFQKQ